VRNALKKGIPMARMTYTSEHYELITRQEMDEGMDYQIGSLKPDPSLKGVRLARFAGS
jgi:hypothetical protein